MAHEHRVAGHLGVEPAEYDRTIRTFIPQYDRMLATIVHWLQANVPADGYVVELGAGTGALAAAILDGLPEVRVQLVDVDPTMLEAAAARCASHEGRFELRRSRFQDSLPRCDAVVATLALHHVADDLEKGRLYHAIHEALEFGGGSAEDARGVEEVAMEKPGRAAHSKTGRLRVRVVEGDEG